MTSVRTPPVPDGVAPRGWLPRAALLAALVLTVACASGGGAARGASGVRGMVVLQNFETGSELRIVSDSWIASQGYEGATADERRVDFYSKKDRTLQAKICDDAVFDGIVEALRQSGFDEHADSGPSPIGGGGARNAVELMRNDAVRHLTFRRGDSDERARAFSDSVKIVGDVYNAITAYQATRGNVDFDRGTVRSR